MQEITPRHYPASEAHIPSNLLFDWNSCPDLRAEVEKYSAKLDLQPGDFAVFNEGNIFHHAYEGTQDTIARIDKTQQHSRFLIHHSVGRPL